MAWFRRSADREPLAVTMAAVKLGERFLAVGLGDTALVTYIANVGTQRGIVTAVYTRSKDNKWLITHLHDTWSMPTKK